jgi:hypothetical protein
MADECWRVDFKEIHDVLITVAKEAGAMIIGAKPDVEGAGFKKNCKAGCMCLEVVLTVEQRLIW